MNPTYDYTGKDVKAAVERTLEIFGRLDFAYNNAFV